MIKSILGPRVPRAELAARPSRFAAPTVLLLAAAVLLVISFFQPYWHMTLHAPQYPGGLHVHAYLDHLEGDIAEIDGLNHYIGMRPLDDAAKLEKSLSLMTVIVFGLLVLAAIVIHSPWAALATLPAFFFPIGFLVDLQLWLRNFGQNLDPTAALSSSVKPFTPPVLGEGNVGQFKTVAVPETGLWIALGASLIILVGLYFHRRAYKPLHAARESSSSGARAAAAIVLATAAAMVCSTPARADATFDLPAVIAAAPEGAEISVPPGVYRGPIVIDRPVRLVAGGEVVIDGGGEGDVLTITSPDVTVRGFLIRSSGKSLDREHAGVTVLAPRVTIEDNVLEDVLFGIYLKEADDGVIRGNVIGGKALDIARRGDGIRLWYSPRTLIEDNEVRRSRDVVMWFSNDVRLRRNHIHDGRYGLHFMYSHDNVLRENRLESNSVGAFLMYSHGLRLLGNTIAYNRGPSGYGVGLKDMDDVTARDNLFVGNRIGIYVDNSPSSLGSFDDFSRNVLAYNDIGVALQPSVRRNRFSENTFLENIEQVAVLGRGALIGNDFTVDGIGNFWSDYRGYDLDGDGVGDLPYRAESLFENLMDREPKLRLFLYSPAQQAIDMASRAFPIVKPEPKISDDAPLVVPVALDAPAVADPGAGPDWLLAAALLGTSAAVLSAAFRPLAVGGRSAT